MPERPEPSTDGVRYRDAGVDVEAGNAAVGRIAALAGTTLGGGGGGGLPVGHFGGGFLLPAGGERLLVASADGIGTKLKLAVLLGGDAHRRVGADLVNHCVNDVLALGARPLFFLDYVAMGRLDGEVVELLVGGMAEACRENGVALIGGETAEMPGLYAGGEYDVAGFIVGEVAAGAKIDGAAIRVGDALIGLPSTGLHTNGYSLARRILGLVGETGADRAVLDRPLPGGGGESVGEVLMRPHPSYLSAIRPLLDGGLIRGMAHITGGGLVDNVPRMLPDGCAVELDVGTWTTTPIFDHLVAIGRVAPEERYRAFNMGIGFLVAVSEADSAEGLALLGGVGGRVVGRVVADDGGPGVRGLYDGEMGGDGGG